MRIRVLRPGLYGPDDLRPAKPGDAGVDVRSAVDFQCARGEEVSVPLGIAIELSPEVVGQVVSRSSTMSRFGFIVDCGQIDSGYRGEIHCMGLATESVSIQRGDRVAQLIVAKIAMPTSWAVVDELGKSERGESGFGSTGAA